MTYPPIVGGASLLIALSLSSQTTLIVGTDALAATRATSALQANSKVIILASKREKSKEEDTSSLNISGISILSEEIKARRDQGELDVIEFDGPDHLSSILDTTTSTSSIAVAFITDTLIGSKQRRSFESAARIRNVFKERNILVNVSDIPSLCDFTLPACHRFTFSPPSPASAVSQSVTTNGPSSSSSEKASKPRLSSLQIAVTTNGRGCRLASRIRREIVSRLPPNIGNAVETVASLRELARATQAQTQTQTQVQDPAAATRTQTPTLTQTQTPTTTTTTACVDVEVEDSQPSSPNEPVQRQGTKDGLFLGESEEERQERRMRWVAQVSEYWPLERLASTLDLTSSFDDLFREFASPPPPQEQEISPTQSITTAHLPPPLGPNGDDVVPSRHTLNLTTPTTYPRGKIYLLGSGPGHPGLLTLSAHSILTTQATLVLSDKLVPSEVLALIPSRVRVKIAKKFPGNAEGAQNELMVEAVEAASRGEIVVRLKQGDPAVYGRVGEEILYFRRNGFESIVVPGITSALSGPSLAGISITQRGVAESMVLCTGVGRQGKPTRLPGYVRSRTLVMLMGVARLESLLRTLTMSDADAGAEKDADANAEKDGSGGGGGLRDGEAYPSNIPIAIIERASMPDQRTIFGTLETIKDAMDHVGEQRPPGMIVVGWAVLALEGEGDVEVLEDAKRLIGGGGGDGKEAGEELRRKDDERIRRWLGDQRWSVREGFVKWD